MRRDLNITIMVFEDLPQQRKTLGWKSADVGGMEVINLDIRGWLSQGKKYIQDHPNAIHVFLGFWTDRRVPALMLYALKRYEKVVVLNEAYSEIPVGYTQEEFFLAALTKVALRPVLYRVTAILSAMITKKHRKLCVMPISLIAREQLLRAGYPPETVYPFGYFVPKENTQINYTSFEHHKGMRLILVASILRRKGVDVAITAIEKINQEGLSVTLDIYGSGDFRSMLGKGNEFVRHKGIVPLEQVQSIIAGYDALLLPSRHDGWGVVVNEALLQGVPVIVSDRVGAKCLVQAGRAGLVFTSGDSHDLAEKIKILIKTPALLAEFRVNATKVGEQISPEHAARYFLEVLNYQFFQNGCRPRAIWSGES